MHAGIRCLGIFGGGLLLSLLLLIAIILPWQEANSFYQGQITQLSDRLKHLNNLIATIPKLEQRRSSLHTNKNLDTYYISATDGATGGIALQQRVEEFAKEVNVPLSSVQVLAPEDQPFATKVGLRLRFGCSTDALWQLLYMIESSKPLLIITAITVRVMRQGPRHRYFNGTEDTTPDLDINMDLYSYIKRVTT